MIGAVFAAWATESLGRKKSIFIGALTATIGGALQAGSVALAMFLVFRFVNGFGVGSYWLLAFLDSDFTNYDGRHAPTSRPIVSE